MTITLLMTATIDPKNCPQAMFSTAERKAQYLEAFIFYLSLLKSGKGGYDTLCFCDNSDADLAEFRALVPVELISKVEFLSAPSLLFPDYLMKSNEFALIDYACDTSQFLKEADGKFFKVTGRYIISNIASLLRDVRRAGDAVAFYCDQKDHRVYSRLGLNWNQQNGEMRYIFFAVDFWRKHLCGYFKKHPQYRAVEEVVFDLAKAHYGNTACRFRFRHEARFIGMQGHPASFMSIRLSPKWDRATNGIRWMIASVLRRVFPNWWF